MRETNLADRYARAVVRLFGEASIGRERVKGIDEGLLAKKYAQAFINVFGDRLTLEKVQMIDKAAAFLSDHPRIIFLMKLPMIDIKVKNQSFDFLCKRFNLDEPIKKLIVLLLQHKRLPLLEQVLRMISSLYKKGAGVESFTIFSSHELSEHDKKILNQFLAQQTGKTIIYKYKIYNQLIAGIRMQSDQHLWEYSIAKQLHTMQLPLIR